MRKKRFQRQKRTVKSVCQGESLAEEYYHNPEETRKKFRWMETAGGMVRYWLHQRSGVLQCGR